MEVGTRETGGGGKEDIGPGAAGFQHVGERRGVYRGVALLHEHRCVFRSEGGQKTPERLTSWVIERCVH